MHIGHTCRLYKTCKICKKTKYVLDFPANTGKKRSTGARKSDCYHCRSRRQFDASVLSGRAIKVKGKKKKGRFEYYLPIKRAKRLVDEGAAGIVHKSLIYMLYNQMEFRHLMVEKNNFTCFYCGEYGDTIDHLIPKSKGGLDTPKNCVCACKKCNQLKSDLTLKEFLEKHK